MQQMSLVHLLAAVQAWCPIKPSPKQLKLLLDPRPSLLFGGAAGGGKSSGLLMLALSVVETPNAAALIIREDLTDMKIAGGLIDLAHQWAREAQWKQRGAKWDGGEHKWTFPSGAVIQFGYAAGGTWTRYLGSAWDLVLWDEAVLSDENAIREVASRLDRTTTGLPSRLRLASNPGAEGAKSHRYLFDSFVNQGLLLPSFVSDNPGIEAERYLIRLREALTADRFRQLADGEWRAVWTPGAGWDPEDVHFVQRDEIGEVWQWVIGLDPSASGSPAADECGIILAALTADRLVVCEDHSFRARPAVWAEHVAALATEYGATVYVEKNLAGSVDRLEDTLDQIDVGALLPLVPVIGVSVRGSKELRHAPVARASRRQEIVFAEQLRDSELVRQMQTWVPTLRGKHSSPDRVDALTMCAHAIGTITVVAG